MQTITLEIDETTSEKFFWLLSHFPLMKLKL